MQAGAEDLPAIRAFLQDHLPLAFYPLANLDTYGLGGDHPRAVRFWLWRQGQEVSDALGVSTQGFLHPIFTTDPLSAAATAMAGCSTIGFGGPPDVLTRFHAALGITGRPSRDYTEPCYHLPLDQLVMPPIGTLALCPMDSAPAGLLTSWRALFLMETQGALPDSAMARAMGEMEEIRARGQYRVLMDGARPVAMTGFNAGAGQAVQVGGVFTPPDLRGRGYGRIAVALHLRAARKQGVTDAYLSAATAPAARAYESLGFSPYGSYRAMIYDEGQVIRG